MNSTPIDLRYPKVCQSRSMPRVRFLLEDASIRDTWLESPRSIRKLKHHSPSTQTRQSTSVQRRHTISAQPPSAHHSFPQHQVRLLDSLHHIFKYIAQKENDTLPFIRYRHPEKQLHAVKAVPPSRHFVPSRTPSSRNAPVRPVRRLHRSESLHQAGEKRCFHAESKFSDPKISHSVPTFRHSQTLGCSLPFDRGSSNRISYASLPLPLPGKLSPLPCCSSAVEEAELAPSENNLEISSEIAECGSTIEPEGGHHSSICPFGKCQNEKLTWSPYCYLHQCRAFTCLQHVLEDSSTLFCSQHYRAVL
jgi:hypothetical protein